MAKFLIRRPAVAAAGLASMALVLSGCLGSGGSSSGASSGADLTGTATGNNDSTVEIMYAFSNDQAAQFKASLDPWAKTNGITIQYTYSPSFPTQIQTRVAGNDMPDIAVFPQPGILTGLANKNKVYPLKDSTDVTKLESSILPGFLSAASVNGTAYGAPISMNVKGLWWYDKANWKAKGYEIPTTEDELVTLFDKAKGEGITPLCYGMESGSDSGWPGTDWIENYMLQTNGADVYDKWVSHEIKFDSPEVRKAFDIYNKLVMTDGYTYGGAKAAASTAFGTALNPMFKTPAGCITGQQGNFIIQKGFFPDNVFKNLDATVGVFATPSVSGEHPVLGGGDLAAMMKKDDATVKVMNYITNDPSFGGAWAKSGGFLSPHKAFDGTQYPNDTLREVAKIAADATVFRFDGSDQMPGAVGSGSFWKGMISYTSGQTDLDTTLKNIDAAWPSS